MLVDGDGGDGGGGGDGGDGGSGGDGTEVACPPSASAVDDVEVPLAAVIGLINASTGRLVRLVAQALETGVWAQAGIRSPEHWLAWKGGVSLGRAHRLYWEDGGTTDLDNALPLCGADHRLHHRGLLGITGDPARPTSLVFTDHHGRVLTRGAEPIPPDPERLLAETKEHLGVAPASWLHRPENDSTAGRSGFEDPPSAA